LLAKRGQKKKQAVEQAVYRRRAGSTPRAVAKYYLLLSIFDLAFLPLLLATAIKLRVLLD